MKKFLSLVALMLTLVCVMASCTIIDGLIPGKQDDVEQYTVTFDLNGGVAPEGFAESVTVNEGETVSLTTPTKENHDFLGWYLNGEIFEEGTPITSNITLKAGWEQNNVYTITYNTNGKADVASAVYIKGEMPKIPETPVAEGYVFFGWYLDEELTERYFFDYAFEEDVTLYAKFYDTSLGEYIVISNVDQLMSISEQPTAKYLLACDINCKGETLIPIDEFSGELEGNGYKIFNFTINETGSTTGFIRINNGTVNNLSFGDFTCDVLISTVDNKYHGIIVGVNNGIINNCHVLDSELKVKVTVSVSSSASCACNIGGIAGHNFGSITDCSNKASINISTDIYAQSTYYGCNVYSYSYIGGITGTNEADAVIKGCANYGEIDSYVYTTGALYVHNYHSAASGGYAYVHLGGIVGFNLGEVDSCLNTADIIDKISQSAYYSAAYGYVGGAIGNNSGKIANSLATGNIVQSGNSDVYVGGFVAYNKGKTYNCYTTANIDINDSSAIIKAVGGFAGENILESGYEATINKCFSTGSITLAATSTDSGYFVGKTSGTDKDCYYLDSATISLVTITESTEGESTETVETVEAVEPTCTVGTAKTETELLSADFIENTLYFDREIWFVYEGKLPTLR